MTQKDEDLMKRYLYQVVRRLPKDQRDEVGLEIQELIGDMLEQSESMEAVLTELGDPAKFARNYRDDGHYLIGPEYFDTYLWFLKIVLICTVVSIFAVSFIEGLHEGLAGVESDYIKKIIRVVIAAFTDAAAHGIVSCVGAFGGVTLIFAVLERQKIKLDLKIENAWTVEALKKDGSEQPKHTAWTPKSLSPVPDKKASISRGDSIVSIVFIVIFSVLLLTAPYFFSAVLINDGVVIKVPLFNLDKWNLILPFLAVALLAGLADEILRLINGVYNRLVMMSNIISGAIQIVAGIIVLKVLPFWNQDFSQQLKEKLTIRNEDDFLYRMAENWDINVIANIILLLIIVFTLLEIGTTTYKTIRYGTENDYWKGRE